ncbi:CRISPR-associated protein [Alphaproteobacteria bacterium]|nr:CRISPR-associated protein [Alphaproteobacteria bacterium]
MTHRILLAVTGLSPQIVTETLYALCVDQDRPWLPDEVHLITSVEGEKRARLTLLDPDKGQFHAFCQDYPQARFIDFREDYIHIISGTDGTPLDDIRTPEDNAMAADSIHSLVQKLTAEEKNELHVSIAGGRKTMGFYLGYCLSLYARAQDRLSHVLVSDPFEGLKDFYFPPATPRLLYTKDNRPIHTSDAKVMLAEIPFVRLRRILPASALNPEQSFSDAVKATQSHLPEKPRISFHRSQKTLICGETEVALQPLLFAWYLWLADRARQDKNPVRYTDAVSDEFLEYYARIIGEDTDDYENTAKLFKRDHGIGKDFFEQKCSRINGVLKKRLALSAQPYLIQTFGKRPETRRGLKLQADEIEID